MFATAKLGMRLRGSGLQVVTIFNNKGGVGKTTLTFHLAHALGSLGKKVLLLDLDPQCNLTIYALEMEHIHTIWAAEDPYIEDFDATRSASPQSFEQMTKELRSIHYILKPTEDGTAELENLPPPCELAENVHLIPGRLTLHLYEAKIAERWSGVYQGDPLSIRTGTRVRALAEKYAEAYGYDYVIFDTSPSLGALNRNLLSLADGFIIPCSPDLFSIYGIRNIGSALRVWRKQFESIFHFLSDSKRGSFPSRFVEFLGFTVYNARKYSGSGNSLGLAQAHYNYASQIPEVIKTYIDQESRSAIENKTLDQSIGANAVIYSHNTLPSMAQKYHAPMWKLPSLANLEDGDKSTIGGNRQIYEATLGAYRTFAQDFMTRVAKLNG
jgi:cellulose biosynthesis protein BcsQ